MERQMKKGDPAVIMEENCSIRRMEREDVDFSINLARNECWNPGIHDADAFYARDPDGFSSVRSTGNRSPARPWCVIAAPSPSGAS